MRARILWAAVLASMLCGLALGLSALAGAAEPQTTGSRDLRAPAAAVPDSTWSAVADMPQPLYGAAAASNGVYAYAAGGIDAGGATLDTFYRYNPVNERWDTYPPADASRRGEGIRRLLPADEQHLRLRRHELGHGVSATPPGSST